MSRTTWATESTTGMTMRRSGYFSLRFSSALAEHGEHAANFAGSAAGKHGEDGASAGSPWRALKAGPSPRSAPTSMAGWPT